VHRLPCGIGGESLAGNREKLISYRKNAFEIKDPVGNVGQQQQKNGRKENPGKASFNHMRHNKGV
jgi:hypothetical protein